MQVTSGSKSRVRDEDAESLMSAEQKVAQVHLGSAPSKGNLSKIGGLARGVTAEDRVERAKTQTQVVPKSVGNLKLDDADAIAEALDDVRADGSPTNWAALTYVPDAKPETLTLAGSGDGGVEEMLATISDGQTYYCLTRHTEKYDATVAVKFARVTLIGPKTKMMLKAKVGTHKGAIEEIMGSSHVHLNTDDVADVSEEALTKMIGKASGTNSNVL